MINLQTLRRRLVSVFAVVMVSIVALPQAALADHEDGFYTQPTFSQWPSPEYDIIIVPPNHGQIYNFETGILGGGDYGELTLENTYLAAVEDAVAAWDGAVQMFGSPRLRQAWVTNAYVVGRDQIPQEALSDPEILVFTDEENGFSLGTTYRAPVCISRMSKFSLLSFTYADMFNVTIHEVGHCLGLGHMGDQGGVDPLSELKHPEHDVMNGFYGDSIGYAGNHLHCASNLNVWGLEWIFRNPRNAIATVGGVSGKIEFPVDQYGTTCEPPGPGKEPPPYPEPPPPVEPPSLTYYERDVDLELRRHLIAVGEVWVYGEQMACVSEVKVDIVRKREGRWVTAKRVVADFEGRFRIRLPDRKGTYAARVSKLEFGDEVCESAASPRLRHRH